MSCSSGSIPGAFSHNKTLLREINAPIHSSWHESFPIQILPNEVLGIIFLMPPEKPKGFAQETPALFCGPSPRNVDSSRSLSPEFVLERLRLCYPCQEVSPLAHSRSGFLTITMIFAILTSLGGQVDHYQTSYTFGECRSV